jgi:uncharacterized protein DUF4439
MRGDTLELAVRAVDVSDIANAWQAALATEQRARFGYGVLGLHLSGAAADSARTAQQAHEQLIADTAAAMSTAGLTPIAPAADYPDLYPVDSAAPALRLALRLEQDAAAAWRYAYATAAGSGSVAMPQPSSATGTAGVERTVRTLAQRALIGSAVRATEWRLAAHLAPPTVAFPGI